MTPGLDWRAEYAGWPVALAKLELLRPDHGRRCATATRRSPTASWTRTSATSTTRWTSTTAEPPAALELPPGLDGALRAIFEDLGRREGVARRPARAGRGADPPAGAAS